MQKKTQEQEEMELAAAKKKKGLAFMLPNQVKNVGNKIRNLFFRH